MPGAWEAEVLRRPRTRVCSARQRREEGLQVGNGSGCAPRRPCGEGRPTAARPAPGSRRGPARPAPELRVRARPAGPRLLLLFLLLLCAAAPRACAGLAWVPGPQPVQWTRGGPRGPWRPRSWALVGAQPPPHAARGPGALRPPREPNAGQGGVPASGERAPAPAPAASSCPAGRKGGNGSCITAGAAPARPPDSRPGALPAEPREPGRRPSRV